MDLRFQGAVEDSDIQSLSQSVTGGIDPAGPARISLTPIAGLITIFGACGAASTIEIEPNRTGEGIESLPE